MTDTTLPQTPHVWTPEARVAFLEALAASGQVREAALAANMSHTAAYHLRHRADGFAFRLGWDAARLIARTSLEDRLMDRAIAGQEDIIEWDEDRRTRSRRHHDNRLALSILGRLDRFAESEHGLHRPAQRIAQDWEAFLALVATSAPDADIRAFCGIDDSDSAAVRTTLEQCKPGATGGPIDPRAEAKAYEARLEHRDPNPCYSIWYRDIDDTFATNFPPPPDYGGEECGEFGEPEYFRDCTEEEVRLERALQARDTADERAYAQEQWRRWFGLTEAVERIT